MPRQRLELHDVWDGFALATAIVDKRAPKLRLEDREDAIAILVAELPVGGLLELERDD